MAENNFQSETAAQLLAATMDEARNLTRFYMAKLKGEDMHRTFEVNGYTTNSPYWILAHLCWAEHMLLIESLGHDPLKLFWLHKFKLGSPKNSASDGLPTMHEVLETMKNIHSVAIRSLSEMTDAELEADNALGISFGKNKTKRFMAIHAIRHEATHCGQLSLIVRMYGKTTV